MIKIKKLHDGAQLPTRASNQDAGADLCCLDAFTLAPGERKLIPTGLAIEIPPGHYGRVGPRSVHESKELAAHHLEGGQIRQGFDLRNLETLVVQISELDLRLLKFRLKSLHRFRGGGDIFLPRDHGQLACQCAAEIGHPRLLGGDPEDGILDDVHLGARLGQAFAQLGELTDRQPDIIDHNEKGRRVQTNDVFAGDEFLFGTHDVISLSSGYAAAKISRTSIRTGGLMVADRVQLWIKIPLTLGGLALFTASMTDRAFSSIWIGEKFAFPTGT